VQRVVGGSTAVESAPVTDPRVAWCLPWHGALDPYAIGGQMMALSAAQRAGIVCGPQITFSALVDHARTDLVEMARSAGATHLLWLDSDIRPPIDVCERLLRHQLPVVGGLYCYKTPPYNPVVFGLEPFRHVAPNMGEVLTRVDGLGHGCLLVDIRVYDLFPAQDAYRTEWPEGEDVRFCRLLGLRGQPIYLDTTVRCEHAFAPRGVSLDDWDGHSTERGAMTYIR